MVNPSPPNQNKLSKKIKSRNKTVPRIEEGFKSNRESDCET